jgi:polar amino acid transport system substrate-binding protein
MLRRAFRAVVAALCGSLILILPAAAAETQTAPTQPGAGFVEEGGVPAPPPIPDIEPVYRGPSIDTLATIRKRGTLRVGVALSEPMVMHNANGDLIGFSIDMAHKLAEDMGVDVELVETSWSHIIPDLLDRRFDVIVAGLWATPARALVVNYSDATVTEGVYLIANKTMAAGMKTEQEFNRPDVKIAVYAGSVQERLAKRHFPQATLARVEGDENHLSPVLEGKAHAVLVPTLAPQLIVSGAPDKLFLPFGNPLSSTFAAMGVRKGDADFLNYLNTWLAFQRDEGWLGDRASYWSSTTDWMK